MLREASLGLAAISEHLTSVARTDASLERQDAEMGKRLGCHHKLRLDWRYPDRFERGILRHVAEVGAPDVVIAWIHDDHLTLRLAAGLQAVGAEGPFYHVIGSATADPLAIARKLADQAARSGLDGYRQVVLGSESTGSGFRWLTPREISHGVLEALSRSEPRVLVGRPPP